jgi:hypothetical protein
VTSASNAGPLSHGAKISIITGGSVVGACLILVSLYLVWRCRTQRSKTLDIGSEIESEDDSVQVPAPVHRRNAIPHPVLTSIPETRVCMGCSETKSMLAAFPLRKITAGCNHEPGFCRRCLERRINLSLVQQGWDQVRCPDNGCGQQLESADVEEFASIDDFQR